MPDLPAIVRLVVFDLDGVVYRGDRPIPGASDLIAALHDRGVTVRFATNNSMVTRAGYVERLGAMGIPTAEGEVVTSTSATVVHLAYHAPDVRRVLGIGADGMREELQAAGLQVTMAASAPDSGEYDAVVVGLDPDVDYRRLSVAMSAISRGARFIATNADARYPIPGGFLPGAGAIVAAVATATGSEPIVIGKPSPAMFTAILEETGVGADACVVVGDNPQADVAGANRAGCASILVLTGVATSEDAEALSGELAPTAIADGPAEVWALLEPRLSP
jgi:HAD superfamily hydrolase (TIGR01450 family)